MSLPPSNREIMTDNCDVFLFFSLFFFFGLRFYFTHLISLHVDRSSGFYQVTIISGCINMRSLHISSWMSPRCKRKKKCLSISVDKKDEKMSQIFSFEFCFQNVSLAEARLSSLFKNASLRKCSLFSFYGHSNTWSLWLSLRSVLLHSKPLLCPYLQCKMKYIKVHQEIILLHTCGW